MEYGCSVKNTDDIFITKDFKNNYRIDDNRDIDVCCLSMYYLKKLVNPFDTIDFQVISKSRYFLHYD